MVCHLKWNSKTKIAKIKYDSDKTSLDEVQKKIASVGYDTEKYKADDKVYNNLWYTAVNMIVKTKVLLRKLYFILLSKKYFQKHRCFVKN